MQNLWTLFKKIRNFTRKNHQEKILFFKAFILCGIVRSIILLIPFNKIKNHIGTYNKESSFDDIQLSKYKVIKEVSLAVNKASKYTPWESKCLVKAITAQKMLKDRKIYSTLYLGVAKDDERNIIAHAWLRSGRAIVTGGCEMNGFKEVAKFSNEI